MKINILVCYFSEGEIYADAIISLFKDNHANDFNFERFHLEDAHNDMEKAMTEFKSSFGIQASSYAIFVFSPQENSIASDKLHEKIKQDYRALERIVSDRNIFIMSDSELKLYDDLKNATVLHYRKEFLDSCGIVIKLIMAKPASDFLTKIYKRKETKNTEGEKRMKPKGDTYMNFYGEVKAGVVIGSGVEIYNPMSLSTTSQNEINEDIEKLKEDIEKLKMEYKDSQMQVAQVNQMIQQVLAFVNDDANKVSDDAKTKANSITEEFEKEVKTEKEGHISYDRVLTWVHHIITTIGAGMTVFDRSDITAAWEQFIKWLYDSF